MTDYIIRPVKMEDAASLLEIYAPYVLNTAISFEYKVPELSEFQGRISTITKRYPYLVAARGEELLGYTYANSFHSRAAYDWNVETTIYVRRDARGGGIGRSLYLELERALMAQGILNMNACIASTKQDDEHLSNASARFHERMGFSLVGRFNQCGFKFHRWYDMIWMEKLLAPHRTDQPPVVPFSDISWYK